MRSKPVVGIVAGIVVLAIAGAVFTGLLAPGQASALRPESVAAADTPVTATSPTIVVSGLGTAKAQPDVAYVNVGIQSRGATAKEAQQEATRLMTSILARLKAMGIADKDIQTSGINVYPINDQGPDKITGYMANNNVNVTVNDISRAGEVLDGAIEAGANTAGGVSLGIKDPAPLEREALADAVKNARPKADAIAQAIGVQIKGVQSISEDMGFGPLYVGPKAAALVEGRGPAPVMPGELTINARVNVVYTY